MADLHDDGVMTAFLLGTLPEPGRSEVDRRLTDDEDYFEAMAALEDELILRWHRGRMSGDERARFERAYMAVPARRARVDAEKAWLDAMFPPPRHEPPQAWWSRARLTLAPMLSPRFALVAATLIVAVTTATLTVRPNRPTALGEPPDVETFTLTAVAERGGSSTRTMDPVRISPQTRSIRLQVVLGPDEKGPFHVVLEAIDGQASHQPPAPTVDLGTTATVVAVTMAPSRLSDGDYILRVQRPGEREPEVVARRAFRVSRGR